MQGKILSQIYRQCSLDLWSLKSVENEAKQRCLVDMPHEDSPHSYRPALTIEVSEAIPPHHLICYKKELALRDPASLSANRALPTALLRTSLHQTASCSETHQFKSFPYPSSFLKNQTFNKS